MKKIFISSDHAGFKLKEAIKSYLSNKKISFTDIGPFKESRVDYPDFAHKLAENLLNQDIDFGILICGSGNGISMAANKHSNIRAALCWNEELATLSRQHNNANVLSLPARFISSELALAIVDVFLATSFEGGRHQRRVNKINCV